MNTKCFLDMTRVVMGFGAGIPSVSLVQLGLSWDSGEEYQVFLRYD